MRKQDFDSAMEALPSGIATFDQEGIPAAINQIHGSGLLGQFVSVLKSSPQDAKTVIGQVWTVPPLLQPILNDVAKLTQVYNQTVGQMLPQANVQQVVTAVTNFFSMLGRLF